MPLKTEFTAKQEAEANLFASLTGKIPVPLGDDKIGLMSKVELLEHVRKMRSEGIGREAFDLLAKADFSFEEEFEDLFSQVTSKSFRVQTPTYLKLNELAYRNKETISDTIRAIMHPKIVKYFGSLKKEIAPKKVELIEWLMNDWGAKKKRAPRGTKELVRSIDESMDSPLTLLSEDELNEIYKEHGIDPLESPIFVKKLSPNSKIEEIMMDLIDNSIWIAELSGGTSKEMIEAFVGGIGNCQFEPSLSIGPNDRFWIDLEPSAHLDFDITNDGSEDFIKFLHDMDMSGSFYLGPPYDMDEDELSNYGVNINSTPMFEDSSKIEDFLHACSRIYGNFYVGEYLDLRWKFSLSGNNEKLKLNGLEMSKSNYKELYSLLLNKILTQSNRNSHISPDNIRELLDKESEVENFLKLMAYDNFFKAAKELANELTDALLIFAEGTQVATFTIPKILMYFFNAIFESKDVNSFLLEALKEGE